MVTSNSVSLIYRLDLYDIATLIYKEIDLKEDEINNVPLMFNNPYINRPMVDITKVTIGDVMEGVGMVLTQNLEYISMVELTLMRMYFGKQDNVSNYVVHRGTVIADQLRYQFGAERYVCTVEGPKFKLEAIGWKPYEENGYGC